MFLSVKESRSSTQSGAVARHFPFRTRQKLSHGIAMRSPSTIAIISRYPINTAMRRDFVPNPRMHELFHARKMQNQTNIS